MDAEQQDKRQQAQTDAQEVSFEYEDELLYFVGGLVLQQIVL